jgi:hypothetical protein
LKIDWINTCRAVGRNPDDDTWNFAGFGIDAGFSGELPVEIAGFLIVAIGVEPYDNDSSELTLRVLDPQMNDLGGVTQRFHPPERGPLHPEGDRGSAIMPVAFRFIATETGTFTLSAALDDQEAETCPFTVLMSASS